PAALRLSAAMGRPLLLGAVPAGLRAAGGQRALRGHPAQRLRLGRPGVGRGAGAALEPSGDGGGGWRRRHVLLAAPQIKKTPRVAGRLSVRRSLERLYVLCLPALGTLHDVELHRLTFLQAAETRCLDGREMHENVFAVGAADEAVALGVVKP